MDLFKYSGNLKKQDNHKKFLCKYCLETDEHLVEEEDLEEE